MARFIGLDLGAETLKAVELVGEAGAWTWTRRARVPHGKEPGKVLVDLLGAWDWGSVDGAAVTGRMGRPVALARVPGRQALAAGFRLRHGATPATVVSIGSRGFSVLELRGEGREIFRENGRCAQGTGNFLQQLVGRFGLTVEEASALAEGVTDPAPLSGRCPVILKTDMTHLANKGESRERILAGLLDAIAENVQALMKPKVCPERLLLAGGVARSARVQAHFRRHAAAHGLTFLETGEEDRLFLEALGCAVLAAETPAAVPGLGALLRPPDRASLEVTEPLAFYLNRVRRLAEPSGPLAVGPVSSGSVDMEPREVVVGFDIGSTGSKAVALDARLGAVLWEGYLPTDGAPVAAAQALMRQLLASPAATHRIQGFGVTGSGREIVGSLLSVCYGRESVWVINEIAAHATGALQCDPRVDTIFEIGGQDAKYIRLADGKVVDAAMNEACSAGTGSFIEEQGRRFTGIESVAQLGQVALSADSCISLGQHCSIFMAEVIDEAVAAGAPQASIISGIYDSVVANYLNRVKGSRSVGQVVFCQGMPFASDALAAAVARQTGAEVIVPPRPGLMGAVGIALLAARELAWKEVGPFDGARFLQAEVAAKDQFVCTATQGCGGGGNKCRIDRLTTQVDGKVTKFTWGGGCSLWDKGTRRAKLPDLAPDPFRERREWLARLSERLSERRGRPLIGISGEFQLQGTFPFFATFLHELGFDLQVAPSPGREALKRGIEEAGVPFCAPMQQYHGLVAGMAEDRPDYLFLPMMRELPRVGGETHSVVCPISQGAPDVLRLLLGEDGPKVLSPVVDHGAGAFDSRTFLAACRALATDLGRPLSWRPAWRTARAAQLAFEADLREMGRRALAFCRAREIVPVVLLGRGYTLHNDVLNSNVPAILREQGALGIPLDCLPVAEDAPIFDEIFWGHSQRILRAAWQVRRTPDLYSIFCSNYACGPDSFTVPMFAWLMEGRPYAVIETDGHSGDAGTKTRVEAFLHCVREDRQRTTRSTPRDASDLSVGTRTFREIQSLGERLLIPPMGPETEAAAATLRGMGVNAEALPPSDHTALLLGRRQTSGKECLPMTLVLGNLLAHLERHPGERVVLLLPAASGPCRMGAYRTLHQLVLKRLGEARRVRIWSPPYGDYFGGLPAGFKAILFAGMAAFGTLERALCLVRAAERLPGQAQAIRDRWAGRLAAHLEAAAKGDLSATRVITEVATGRVYGLPALLRQALGELRQADSGADLPRVLLTGEIYVRLDPFANGEAARALASRGLRVDMEATTEFIQYSEHTSRAQGAKKGPATQVERWIRERILAVAEGLLEAELGWPRRGSLPRVLEASAPYLREALEGEAVLTLGAPILGWRRGEIDAAVLVGPLECMPSKLADAQFIHVAEREGLLTLSLSLNGEPPDPEALDAFAFEVHRRHQHRRHRRARRPAPADALLRTASSI
ncbi:BadF/BadG/BcrA/BcrD ATPase family protein [Geothrix alkalitolerans]|uniref:BadF/BadG/BcrA/BcrD ATPase family protein n=1 Tax=Geothrix alkalitolerans TaxID=2922724 RepID=UPI001FAF4C0F|nr:BadF/BadG/BcrA/BcrD ATPase family protein [Geothrix alkalitolerans]